MFTFPISCVLAFSALANPVPLTDPVNFVRTYEPNEKSSYQIQMTMNGMDMGANASVEVTAKKKTPTSKWQMTVVTTKIAATGQDTTPPEKPDDLVVTLSANNLPEDLNLKKMDVLNFWLIVGQMTAGKPVELGQEIPVNWSSKAGFIMGVKGSGKVTVVDPTAKTTSVTWTLDMSVSGQSMGETVFKSVYDTKNFSLKSCEGTAMKGSFLFKVKRIDKPVGSAVVGKYSNVISDARVEAGRPGVGTLNPSEGERGERHHRSTTLLGCAKVLLFCRLRETAWVAVRRALPRQSL